SRQTAMKQLRRSPYTPSRRGGRAAQAPAQRKRDSAQPQVMPAASIKDRRKVSAELTTPALRATRPLPGEESPKREIQRLKAELQQQQQEQRQQTHEQLRGALWRYEELYNFAPISLITLDRRGMIISLNERAGRLLGFPIQWLRERPFIVFVAPHDVLRFLDVLTRLRRVLATETVDLDLFVNDRLVPVQLSIGSSLLGAEFICR